MQSRNRNLTEIQCLQSNDTSFIYETVDFVFDIPTVWIIKYGDPQLILKDNAVFFYSTIDCGFLPSGHGLFRVNVRIPLSE